MIPGAFHNFVVARNSRSTICLACRLAIAINRRDLHYALQPAECSRSRLVKFNDGRSRSTSQRYASKKSRPKGAEALYLPDSPTRTRFAPSPTGQLHIGGLRTALFSYLIAKRTHGQFILRIEDTDQKRLVAGAEQRLIDDLRWAGLTWDEGPDIGGPYGPYRQSDRNPIYQFHAEKLLESGKAYRCFCTAQTSHAEQNTFVTSGCYQACSSLDAGESSDRANIAKTPYTIRLHARGPSGVYTDLVYGNVVPLKRSAPTSFATDGEDGTLAADTILMKSDGTPTYHFANVVDDHLMKITHVIRGTEWMASMPLHVDLYRAFGWEPPIFAHVGLLVNEDQAKLSKRDKDLALDVAGMRQERHTLPEALCNFLALLGWRYPGKDETCTMDDLVKLFDLRFTRGNAMVTMTKLEHLQKKHARRRCDEARITGSNTPIQYMIDEMIREIKVLYPNAEARIGGYHSLNDRCAQILLYSTLPYINPAQFVKQHEYLLTMDEANQTDNQGDVGSSHMQQQISDQNDDELSPDVTQLIRGLFEHFHFKKQYRAPLFPGRTSPSTLKGSHTAFQDILRQGQIMNAAIDETVWRNVWPDARDEDLPFTDDNVDHKAYATHFAGDAQKAEQLFTAWSTMKSAVIRYLRANLMKDQGGMPLTYAMAILGYEECCRRMGLSPHADGGWECKDSV